MACTGGRIFKAGSENLSGVLAGLALVGQFDAVVASHSFEHAFRPITALREACSALKPHGAFVLFVPDAFSDDPSTKTNPYHVFGAGDDRGAFQGGRRIRRSLYFAVSP